MLRVLDGKKGMQIVRHGKDSALAVLSCARIEPHLAGLKIHVPPLPMTGGAGQVVCPITNLTFPLCSSSDGCIAFEIRPAASIVFSVDVGRGKGPEVATLPRPTGTAKGTELLFIRPDGTSRTMWSPTTGAEGAGKSRRRTLLVEKTPNPFDKASIDARRVACFTSTSRQVLTVDCEEIERLELGPLTPKQQALEVALR
jgi:hypothetical protein